MSLCFRMVLVYIVPARREDNCCEAGVALREVVKQWRDGGDHSTEARAR